MRSLQGHFLVASPHLPDPNFFRSVVLMIHHDAEGAFGVVLNRPTERTVAEVWEMMGAEACESAQRINVGGPVAGPLLAIHMEPAYAETEILPGLFMATRQDYLHELVDQAEGPFHLFSGYSGWGEGQLEQELEVGSWLTIPASVEDVFSEPDELWKRIARHIGMDILAPTLPTRHMPDDPSLN